MACARACHRHETKRPGPHGPGLLLAMTPRMPIFARSALPLALALVLAACGSSGSDSPGETSAQTSAATPAATQDNGGDGDAAGHEARDLEAVLPTEVGGVPLSINSFRGAESFREQGFTLEELTAAVDRDIDDVSIATAVDASQGSVSIFVMRIEGVQSQHLVDFFREDQPELGFEDAEVGGKNVVVSENGGIYLYPTGDLLFQVFGAPDAAATALAELP